MKTFDEKLEYMVRFYIFEEVKVVSQQNSIKFKYAFADDYEPEYINGVHGGVSPNGELVVHFFMDRATIPNVITQAIREDGTLDGKDIQPEPSEPMIRRTIKSGIVMSPSTALSVYQWLKQRLGEMGVDDNDL